MKLFKENIAPRLSTLGDKIYPLVVDIKKGVKSGDAINFVTADNEVGILSIELVNGDEPYDISGCIVCGTIQRPDTSTLNVYCDIVGANKLEIPLGVSGTYQEGIHNFDLKIYRGNEKVIGVPTMSYTVTGSLSSDGVVEGDDRLPVLTTVLDNAQDRLSRLDKAIAGATNDLEVKEARDGEVSLSARLFRDLYGRDNLLKTTILEQEIQELYNHIGDGGNVDLSPIKNRLERIEAEVGTYTESINTNSLNITSNTNAINLNAEGITNITNKIDAYKLLIDDNTANITATRGEISTKVNSTKSELYSAISSVEGEVSTVNQRLTDTTVTLEGEIESVGEELDTLSENIPRLDNKISTLDRKVTDQSNNIANIVQSMQRIHYSTVEPTKSDGEDGDLWVIYGESTLFEQAVTLEETDFVVTDEYGTMFIPD